MTGQPDYPITELAQFAAQMHELFEEYIKAGFTEQQALYLVGHHVNPGDGAD